MRLNSATIYALRIPFREQISHSMAVREFSDSVVLRLQSEDGHVGYGECTPRPYVTGETVGSVIQVLAEQLWPAASREALGTRGASPTEVATAIDKALPDVTPSNGVIAHNSARAAMEIALLDCAFREEGMSWNDMLPPCRHEVTYSGMVPGGELSWAVGIARREQDVGLQRLKVKVGDDDDIERLRAMRESLGPDAVLYVDANCGWTFQQAVERIAGLKPFGIVLVEQPIPRGPVAELARLRAEVDVPIMVDESLVTLDDARALIDAKACDFFNIRLSKCGGVGRCLEFARLAADAGIGYQLGAHIGETSILSAAGRFLAMSLENPLFVEGSVGPLLLETDVTEPSVGFDFGGIARPLEGAGLGIQVLDERLESCSERRLVLEAAG